MNLLFSLLAQAAPGGAPQPGAGTGMTQVVGLVLVVGVFWWIMSRGKNKERRRYEQMLNALKKNDRIQTIGGLLGTVVDVRDNEVVVKVDETNNVKVRFVRSAIKDVVSEAAAVESKGN
jgi:preprotein translocase subunit YajC